MRYTNWHGCYNGQWKGLIPDAAFAHPAKFSRALIARIYDHLFDAGLLREGDRVIDPFGGVALGALDAMIHGLSWCGVELEERFVRLGEANIAEWNRRFGRDMPHWGTARIIHGDSRRLCEVLAGTADGVVSSPPYASETVNARNGIDMSKSDHRAGKNSQALTMDGYGNSAGQLANLPEGNWAGCVSSPPYEASMSADKGGIDWEKAGRTDRLKASPDRHGVQGEMDMKYSPSPSNLGNQTGGDFWSASRLIVGQTYALLRPGGVAAWVCKDFIRRKQRVPFSDQWRQLCEACGFTTVEWVHAMLTETSGGQVTFEGETEVRVKSRKSFFRRLAEKNGSPCIDWEDVLIMRKERP